MSQRSRRSAGVALVALVLALVAKAATLVGRTSLIIEHGVRLWSTLDLATNVLLVLTGGTAVILMVRRKREVAQLSEHTKNEMELKRSLPYQIQETKGLLAQAMTDEETRTAARRALGHVDDQLREAEDCERKLTRLLAENDASVLSDSLDLVHQVEGSICRNIQALVNYANVLDLDKDADEQFFLSQAKDYHSRNQELLESLQAFLLDLTRYLNESGSRSDATAAIESYRQVIRTMTDKEP